MAKVTTRISAATLASATESVKATFFELATNNYLPRPDEREFIITHPCKATEKFNMRMEVTLKSKKNDKSGAMLFKGIAISEENQMPYLEINYELPGPRP